MNSIWLKLRAYNDCGSDICSRRDLLQFLITSTYNTKKWIASTSRYGTCNCKKTSIWFISLFLCSREIELVDVNFHSKKINYFHIWAFSIDKMFLYDFIGVYLREFGTNCINIIVIFNSCCLIYWRRMRGEEKITGRPELID